MSYNNEIYIAHWEQTRWLVLSSFFFMIPATYAFINQLYNILFYYYLLL